MNWITENYIIVLGLVGALLVAARYATSLTKTKRDDKVVAKIEEAFGKVEDLVTGRDSEKPE